MADEKSEEKKLVPSKKRAVAKQFIAAYSTPKSEGGIDKRRLKKIERFKTELANGEVGAKTKRDGTPVDAKKLNVLDIITRANFLIVEGGMVMSAVRNLCKGVKPIVEGDTLVSILSDMHVEYGFDEDAYRVVGVSDEQLLESGIISVMPPKRGPRAKGDNDSENSEEPESPASEPATPAGEAEEF